MRVLILVLSSHEPPYDGFMKAQKETWDSIHHPDIETVYYHGSGDNTWDGNVYRSDCPHGYYYMHYKHKQALDACWHMDWDIVFRTNSSSYVNKRLLFERARYLPVANLYGGYLLARDLPPLEWNGKMIMQDFVSGAGIYYSRDIADLIRNNTPPGLNIEDDVFIGRLLQYHGRPVNYLAQPGRSREYG